MTHRKTEYNTIDGYILQFPEEVQVKLRELRRVIIETAPDATEKISYQMPTYYQKGNLVHFAAYKKHIGFYPSPSGIEAFKNELVAFKGAKGSVQFPLDEPIPYEIVRRIVEYRVAENIKEAEKKKKK